MPTGVPVADAVQSGLGLVQSAIGLINAGKAKKEAEQLAKTRPQYEISPLADQYLSLTKSDLANGMSSAAEKAYNDLNNQQFSSSLGAIIRGGGDVNNIGSLYGNSQDGRTRLALMKDQLRLQQINNYARANAAMQQEQQTKWQVNEFAPWQDKAQANAAARVNAQGQIWGGLNTAASGVANAGQQMQEQKNLNVPIVMNPNNPNFTPSGLALPENNVPDYVPSNYNFSGAGNLNNMNMPTYNG